MLTPELLHRAVSCLEEYAKKWLAAVNEGLAQIDQQLAKINADLPIASEEKKSDLLEELHRLEDAKVNLKRSMIDMINQKQVPFRKSFRQEIRKTSYPKALIHYQPRPQAFALCGLYRDTVPGPR